MTVWKLKVLYRKFNVVIEKNFGYGIIKYREKYEFMTKNRMLALKWDSQLKIKHNDNSDIKKAHNLPFA